jgi:L-malate glycosyltransferase
MRVMWLVNAPLPVVHRRMGRIGMRSGPWIDSLYEHVVRTPGITLDVVTASQGMRDDRFSEDGVNHFVIGQPRYYPFFKYRKKDLERTVEIVRERRPDLVHIHGTERFFGLIAARKLVSTPCVISLQGLLEPYVPELFGALSPVELWRSHRLIEIATRRGLFWQYRDFVHGARREREILAGTGSFMGRTDWDRAHVRSANATADYYYVGEVLRPAFEQHRWDISECERHSVIFTNVGEPRRGTEVLLKAMLTVRREFPDAKLRLGGHVGNRRGYQRFLRQTIADSGLSEAVEFLGHLDAGAMARELRRTHVFAMSSYIENSPNSLCEAMQVGLPCVATYAGGIPSLVQHGQTGLLFPSGDAPLLAEAIARLFREDDLACRLGRAARIVASERHAPDKIVSQLLDAYEQVMAKGQPPGTHASMACLQMASSETRA